ncbi:MAG: winged helix-turn-helix domain-containing protein [Candidatus Bathyarchaeia archaeon]
MNRHQFEVMVKLLRFTEEEKRKTKIMSHCSLSYATTTNTIDILLKSGLLEEKRNFYRTTAKGSEFVKGFEEIENIFNAKESNKTSCQCPTE